MLHNLCSRIQYMFGLTWTGRWRSDPLSLIWSSKSAILWIYGAFKTTGNSKKKTRLNHDISDLQFRALERGQRSQLGIPSWITVQNVFSQSEISVVLNSLKSEISQLREVMLDWQNGQCWMFILLSLEKRPLNPDLDTHSTENKMICQ
jgi:predicted XRE-type DNA-binding protein